MGYDLADVEPALTDFMCGNIFVETGIGAAGLALIQRSNFYGAAAVAIASYAFGKACENRGFDPSIHLPGSAGFEGGQCQIRYRVMVEYRRRDGRVSQAFSTNWGPIGGFRIVENGGPGTGYVQILSHGIGGVPDPGASWDFPTQGNAGGDGQAAAMEITDVILGTFGGELDNCGNPADSEVPVVGNPDDPLLPGDAPFTVPDPGDPGNNFTFNAPIVDFKVDKLLGVDGPLVSFNVGGVLIQVNYGTDPPTVRDPNQDVEEITRRQFEKMEKILDLLDQVRECVCRPGVELESLYLPYAVCSSEEEPSQVLQQLLVPRGQYGEDVIEKFNNSADLASLGCTGPTVFAVPDSYNQRRPSSPPTLVLVYRKEGSRTYHSYCIPHPKSTDREQDIPISSFRKGPILGNIYFADNSCIAVNCESVQEANRVVSAFSGLVEAGQFGDDSYFRFVERRGSPIQPATMNLVSVAYYPDGNRTLMPEWRRSIRNRL